MNRLDHVVNNNIKTNKDQLNGAIYDESAFDNSSFNSSRGIRDPLPVGTVTIRGGKKHRATAVAGLTCTWDNRATDSIINRKDTKNYERNMRYDKVEYIRADVMNCTTHDSKMFLCIPEFSSSKIINHCFHVDSDKGESGTGYEMIIGRDLMVQLDLMSNFKH